MQPRPILYVGPSKASPWSHYSENKRNDGSFKKWLGLRNGPGMSRFSSFDLHSDVISYDFIGFHAFYGLEWRLRSVCA